MNAILRMSKENSREICQMLCFPWYEWILKRREFDCETGFEIVFWKPKLQFRWLSVRQRKWEDLVTNNSQCFKSKENFLHGMLITMLKQAVCGEVEKVQKCQKIFAEKWRRREVPATWNISSNLAFLRASFRCLTILTNRWEVKKREFGWRLWARTLCLKCLILSYCEFFSSFYRTRVRSLPGLVTHSR